MKKFILFNNLGKLAKYLRFLGFDAMIAKHISQGTIERLAKREKRIILSRKKQKRIKERYFIIESENPLTQLTEISTFLKIDEKLIGSRCLNCNKKTVVIAKEKIQDRIPKHIQENHQKFRFCPKCGKIFWQGSHYKNLKQKLLSSI